MSRIRWFVVVAPVIGALAAGGGLLWPSPAASQGTGTSVALVSGWNNVAYTGDGLTLPAALNDAQPLVSTVMLWDPASSSWHAWSTALPPTLIDLPRLDANTAIWVQASTAGMWNFVGGGGSGGGSTPATSGLTGYQQVSDTFTNNDVVIPPIGPQQEADGSVECPSGTVVLGGGATVEGLDGAEFAIAGSRPTVSTGAVFFDEPEQGWYVQVREIEDPDGIFIIGDEWTVTVYATCAAVAS